MSEEQLLETLYSQRLHKERIEGLVKVILAQPKLVKPLLYAVFEEDQTEFFNASWVFDHVMRKNLLLMLPHLKAYVEGLFGLTNESGIRSMAHTCQMILEAYFKERIAAFKSELNEDLLEKLVEINFDWLLGAHKVATKVFAMTSLFYLGEKYAWIYPELKAILQNTIAEETAGYKSRAKKTLDGLAKLGY